MRLQNLTRIYRLGDEEIIALNNVSLGVDDGEYLVIMGPSGSGKSTALNLIGGLDFPSHGKIIYQGHPLSKMNGSQLASYRTFEVGYIFQAFNLIESLNAFDNVRIPLILANVPKERQKKRVEHLLEIVGLSDRAEHKPRELSGGQKQRVAIARALANKPRLLLADEPTGNLDLRTGLKIMSLLDSINQMGVTVVNCTHDIRLIDAADRITWLRDGKVETIQKKIFVQITSEDIKTPLTA